MILTVVREFHWAPSIVGALYIDAEDYEGLEYWYNDVVKTNKELNPKAKDDNGSDI
jgi:hypothetical protein